MPERRRTQEVRPSGSVSANAATNAAVTAGGPSVSRHTTTVDHAMKGQGGHTADDLAQHGREVRPQIGGTRTEAIIQRDVDALISVIATERTASVGDRHSDGEED